MKILAALLSFLSLILFSCVPNYTVRIKVPVFHQSTNYTCWASSLAMVASYTKKINLSDCEVVAHVNRIIGLPDNCCTEGGRACLRGGSVVDIMLALEILFRINYRFEARPLSFEEIRQAIDAGQPIIAVRVYPLGGAHANVIVGYNAIKKTLVVAEPTFGQENIEPYNSFVGNLLSGIWVGAFVITSRPPDRQMCHWVCDEGGCHNLVCRFNPGESRETALREE